MPNIGPAELIVILLVALVVFGPRKLPELGKSLGAGLREFRKSTQSLKDELDGSLNDKGPQAAPTQTIHASVPAQAVSAPPMSVAAVTPPAEGGAAPVELGKMPEQQKETVQS
ncbi:twin-arginine translocase TatA/TatE family subunit [Deinococcus radiopugnans]|uniref:Sec-independent protein translocase protein TatA n=1 Tax=Deinococcus radiopugnans ATCC 19172 TaxID=585398 RepID=A0A5C4Y9W9_9DEIO|nr:twin-arginine translocase TatA/TatE family subunit [Deinococcus radiopugnans]MBB6015949.1 sec-independent protein translocase protein TatA [Deinococcus radiopugnans ATCC 19172]TNM72359.1 twin-arginine translocase TatA/TatE family subunit [Deinococcus radiopugnans ATCC 19172]